MSIGGKNGINMSSGPGGSNFANGAGGMIGWNNTNININNPYGVGNYSGRPNQIGWNNASNVNNNVSINSGLANGRHPYNGRNNNLMIGVSNINNANVDFNSGLVNGRHPNYPNYPMIGLNNNMNINDGYGGGYAQATQMADAMSGMGNNININNGGWPGSSGTKKKEGNLVAEEVNIGRDTVSEIWAVEIRFQPRQCRQVVFRSMYQSHLSIVQPPNKQVSKAIVSVTIKNSIKAKIVYSIVINAINTEPRRGRGRGLDGDAQVFPRRRNAAHNDVQFFRSRCSSTSSSRQRRWPRK
jgi:hypothetical protein